MPPLSRSASINEMRRVFTPTCKLIDEELQEVRLYSLIYHLLGSFEGMNQQGRLPRTAIQRFLLQFVIVSMNKGKPLSVLYEVRSFFYL